MIIYLPDTNAISAYLRGGNPVFVTRFQAGFVHARLSAIVVAEREFGFVHGPASGRQHQRFQELLSLLPVEPFTRQDSAIYAKVRSTLEKRGQGIGPLDTLIAAQALRLNATVITHNIREFSRVPALKVEDWQAA